MSSPQPLPKRLAEREQRKPLNSFIRYLIAAIGLILSLFVDGYILSLGTLSLFALAIVAFSGSISAKYRREDKEDQRRLELNRDFWRIPAEKLGLQRSMDEDVTADDYQRPRLSGIVDNVHVQAAVIRYRTNDSVYDTALISARLDEPWASLDFKRSGFAGQAKSLSRLGQTGLVGDSEFDRRWSISSHLQEQALTHLAPEARTHFNVLHDAPWAQSHLLEIRERHLHLRYQSQYELRGEKPPRWMNFSEVNFDNVSDALEATIKAAATWTRQLQEITDQCERSLEARLARDSNATVRAIAFEFVNDGYLNDSRKNILLRAGCQSPHLDTRIQCAEALGDEAKHILDEANALLASKQGAVALSGPADVGDVSVVPDADNQ
jgi:hypothetical protein